LAYPAAEIGDVHAGEESGLKQNAAAGWSVAIMKELEAVRGGFACGESVFAGRVGHRGYPNTAKLLLSEQGSLAEKTMPVEALLHGFHRGDVFGSVLVVEKMRLAFTEAVLGSDCPSHRDNCAGEFGDDRGGAVHFLLIARQQFSMDVCVADVSEHDEAIAEIFAEDLAVGVEDLAIAF
jgi:hypothetical protein